MDASPFIHPKNLLRQERIKRNWRQQEVADLLGTTVASVKRWERGSHQPSLYFREKLCALFDKSIEELGLELGGTKLLLLPSSEKDATEEEEAIHASPIDSPGLWTVPYRRNLYFTGRDDLLDLLDQRLSGAGSEETATHRAALTQPQAMKGLGGIGKTQIAVEYAYRAREQGHYIHTLWINAASHEALMTSFTQLAYVLPAFPRQNETDHHKLVEAIKHWLELCPERWLLIFDNADDLSLVQGSIPTVGNGSVLLTTRTNAVGSLAVSIDVETMGFVEGTHLLLRRAQRFLQASDQDINEAGNIVIALDHFPLALEQAGAYIEETGCSFSHYLQLYQNHRCTLLARRGTQTTNYPDSVITTWSLSFHKVEQTNPAAALLLRLCAFLAPDRIPEELLLKGAPHWPPLLQQAITNPLEFDQMLESLLAFSLVKRLANDHMLSIHRLVQVVQIEMMGLEEQLQWIERAIKAVTTVIPNDPEDVSVWPHYSRYLDQAQACATFVTQHQLTSLEAADLLYRVGVYLRQHNSHTEAEALYLRALHIREQLLGEHPDTASALNSLAVIYDYQGKYKEAEALYLRALHIREQLLGEHSNTAATLNSLAVLYRQQGKYSEAESLYLRALHIREQLLGEHPDTASVLNNLAVLYRYLGKYTEAESLYLRALHIREQHLRPEHPDLVVSLSNLGTLYRLQGKYPEAELLFQRALAISEHHFGSEHPYATINLNHLANLYREQGKYPEAELLFQRVLSIREKLLGPEHLDTAHSLVGLARLYTDQGKYTQAEALYQRALHIRTQHLGSQHPETIEILHNLASLREAQGNIQEAKSLYEQALALREQTLGEDHPQTQETRKRYMALLQTIDHSSEAPFTEKV